MSSGPRRARPWKMTLAAGRTHRVRLPDDLALRERFVVLSTSAVLSIPRHRRTCAAVRADERGQRSSAHWITRSGCARTRRRLRRATSRIRWSSSCRRRHCQSRTYGTTRCPCARCYHVLALPTTIIFSSTVLLTGAMGTASNYYIVPPRTVEPALARTLEPAPSPTLHRLTLVLVYAVSSPPEPAPLPPCTVSHTPSHTPSRARRLSRTSPAPSPAHAVLP